MFLNNNRTYAVYPQYTVKPPVNILLSMVQKSLIKYKYIALSVTNLVAGDVTLNIAGGQSNGESVVDLVLESPKFRQSGSDILNKSGK